MIDKCVYVGMCADLIHHGHINILKEAKKYGVVIVGLLTDEAICTYKKPPLLTYEQRKIIILSILYVDGVAKQKELDYVPNLIKIRPNYVLHADDWREGKQKEVRQRVIDTLKEWGGSIIEVPYTKGISSTILKEGL